MLAPPGTFHQCLSCCLLPHPLTPVSLPHLQPPLTLIPALICLWAGHKACVWSGPSLVGSNSGGSSSPDLGYRIWPELPLLHQLLLDFAEARENKCFMPWVGVGPEPCWSWSKGKQWERERKGGKGREADAGVGKGKQLLWLWPQTRGWELQQPPALLPPGTQICDKGLYSYVHKGGKNFLDSSEYSKCLTMNLCWF